MNKEKKNLLAFGYGLAMFIPYFILVRIGPLKINSVPFVISFIFILVILSNLDGKKWLYYLLLVINYYLLFTKIGSYKFSLAPVILLILAVLIFAITIFKVEYLKPFYKLWMKVAHFIGNIVTAVILSIIFYCIFGLVGIVTRILGKDLLNQKLDRQSKSYWLTREQKVFDKANYTRQF